MRNKTAVAAVVMLMVVFKTTAYAFPSIVTETWRSNYTKAEVADDQSEIVEEAAPDVILESAVIQEEQEDSATPTNIDSNLFDDANNAEEEKDLNSPNESVIDTGPASADEDVEVIDEPDEPDEPDANAPDSKDYEMITTPDEAEELIAVPGEAEGLEEAGE